jgi:hypothetical protein
MCYNLAMHLCLPNADRLKITSSKLPVILLYHIGWGPLFVYDLRELIFNQKNGIVFQRKKMNGLRSLLLGGVGGAGGVVVTRYFFLPDITYQEAKPVSKLVRYRYCMVGYRIICC